MRQRDKVYVPVHPSSRFSVVVHVGTTSHAGVSIQPVSGWVTKLATPFSYAFILFCLTGLFTYTLVLTTHPPPVIIQFVSFLSSVYIGLSPVIFFHHVFLLMACSFAPCVCRVGGGWDYDG